MAGLGKRIQLRRKELNLSQSELAQKVNLSYAQIGRYETKDAQPPAEVLQRIADVLSVSADFLINGSTDEKAKASLKDDELLRQFKAVEQMGDDDRHIIKKLIDAFITKKHIQKLAH